MNTTRIIFVRHCETVGNKENIFQGRLDTPISENGKIQLELLALRLRNMKIDSIYTSPLKRAVTTAETINQYHHLPIQICEEVVEISGGIWEGNKIDEFAILYPEDEDTWARRPWAFHPQNGESMDQVFERVWVGVHRVIKENPGKTVCLVSHGCAIRNILCHCHGKRLEEIGEIDFGSNTAVSIVDFDEDGAIHIILENDSSHLNAWKEMVKDDNSRN